MDLIVIPTRGRAKRQQTLATLEKTDVVYTHKVVLLVRPEEVAKYRHPSYKGKRIKSATMKEIDVVAVPEDCEGISKKRAYALTTLAKQYDAKYLMMLDDDLSFCHRPDLRKADMPYINADAYGMHWMLETITEQLEKGYAHVGLISRQANRKLGVRWQKPGRLMNAYAYNVPIISQLIRKHKLVLGRLQFMEDFDLTLQLLRLGYPNRISCRFAWTTTSNLDGGCSTYRTAEAQAEAARKLAKLHKPFVQVVEKQAKTWKNSLTARVDVRVAWKKAYEASKGGKRG